MTKGAVHIHLAISHTLNPIKQVQWLLQIYLSTAELARQEAGVPCAYSHSEIIACHY